MWNLSQVSPHGPDKIKDKTPEKKLGLISSHERVTEEQKCEWNLQHCEVEKKIQLHKISGIIAS